MTELGMTPAARSRVAVAEDPRMALPVTYIFKTVDESEPDKVIEAIAVPAGKPQ